MINNANFVVRHMILGHEYESWPALTKQEKRAIAKTVGFEFDLDNHSYRAAKSRLLKQFPELESFMTRHKTKGCPEPEVDGSSEVAEDPEGDPETQEFYESVDELADQATNTL